MNLYSYDCEFVVCLNSSMTFWLLSASWTKGFGWGLRADGNSRNDASVSPLLHSFLLCGWRGLLESCRSKKWEHLSSNKSWFHKVSRFKSLKEGFGIFKSQGNGFTVWQCCGVCLLKEPPWPFHVPFWGGMTNLLEKGTQLRRSLGPRWCTDAHSLETGFNFSLRPACPLHCLQKTYHD